MKKYLFIIISAILIVVVVISKLMVHDYEYTTGSDTHKSFGNGEYQIMVKSYNKQESEYDLYNMKYKETIIDSLQSYTTKANYVYFYGSGVEDIYVLLDIDNNKIIYYSPENKDNLIYYNDMIEDNVLQVINSFDELKDEDVEIFNELKNKSTTK